MRYIIILLFLSACSSIDRNLASDSKTIISVNLYSLKKLKINHFNFNKGASWKGIITFLSDDLAFTECSNNEKKIDFKRSNFIEFTKSGRSRIKCIYKGSKHVSKLKLKFERKEYKSEEHIFYSLYKTVEKEKEKLLDLKEQITKTEDLSSFIEPLKDIYTVENKTFKLSSSKSNQSLINVDKEDTLIINSTGGYFSRSINFKERRISANGYRPNLNLIKKYSFPNITPHALVCHIRSRVLFSGTQKKISLNNNSGLVKCIVNSKAGKNFKNNGNLKINYSYIKRSDILKAVDKKIEETEKRENKYKTQIDKWVKEGNESSISGLNHGIARLLAANSEFSKQAPANFTKKEIKHNGIKLSKVKTYYRPKTGAFCTAVTQIKNRLYSLCDKDNEGNGTYLVELSKNLNSYKYIKLDKLEGSAGVIVPINDNRMLVYSEYSSNAFYIRNRIKREIQFGDEYSIGSHFEDEENIYLFLTGEQDNKIALISKRSGSHEVLLKMKKGFAKAYGFENKVFILYSDSNLYEYHFIDGELKLFEEFRMPHSKGHYLSIEKIDRKLVMSDSKGYIYSFDIDSKELKEEFVTFYQDDMNPLSNPIKPKRKGVTHNAIAFGENIVIATQDSRLYFLNKNFELLWVNLLNGFRGITGQPHVVQVDDEELLWVPGSGWNYLIGKSGEIKAIYQTTGGENYSNLLVDKDWAFFGYYRGIHKIRLKRERKEITTIINKKY